MVIYKSSLQTSAAGEAKKQRQQGSKHIENYIVQESRQFL